MYNIKIFINGNYVDACININRGQISILGNGISIYKSVYELTNCILFQNTITMYFGNEQINISSNEAIQLKTIIDNAKMEANAQMNRQVTMPNSNKSSVGKIIGIVVGIVAFLIICLAIIGSISSNNKDNTKDIVIESSEIEDSSQDNSNSESIIVDEDNENAIESNKLDYDYIKSQLKIDESSYIDSINYKHTILEVTNPTEYSCRIEVKINYFDAQGNMIDYDTETIAAMPANYTTIVSFSSDEDYATTKIETTVSNIDSWFSNVTADKLSIDYNETKDGFVGTITNNGDTDADFVKVFIALYKDGQIIDTDYTYTEDVSIKPSEKSNFKSYVFNEDYDSYKLYVIAD